MIITMKDVDSWSGIQIAIKTAKLFCVGRNISFFYK